MDLEQKLISIKALSEEGQIEAVISTFGNIDRDGDIMLADAFADSNGKSIPMVWSHNWDQPVGKGSVKVSPSEAIFAGQFFMDTEKGQDAFKTVKAMGDLQQYSIGFRIREADFGYVEDDAGVRTYVRTIKNIELFEASPVLVGAAYGTRTLAIKSGHTPPPEGEEPDVIEKALADIEAEIKAGATLSAANLTKLHSAMTQLMALHDASNCEMGGDCPMADMSKSTESDEHKDGHDLVFVSPQRKAELRELQEILGFRPLIAGAAKLD